MKTQKQKPLSIAFIVAMFLTPLLVGMLRDSWWRYLVVLAPVLLSFLLMLENIRGLERLDELQRKIQHEALAVALYGLMILGVGYYFLELAGAPRIPMVWVPAVAIVLQAIATIFLRRKYEYQ